MHAVTVKEQTMTEIARDKVGRWAHELTPALGYDPPLQRYVELWTTERALPPTPDTAFRRAMAQLEVTLFVAALVQHAGRRQATFLKVRFLAEIAGKTFSKRKFWEWLQFVDYYAAGFHFDK